MGASATAGTWVPPRPHLLKDLAAEKLFSFRLETAYDSAQQKLLLAGVDTFLTPGEDFCSHTPVAHPCIELPIVHSWMQM